MLILSPGQSADFEFIFNQNNNFYDPTSGATPSDVVISIYRGDLGSGAIIDGPFSYLYQDATPSGNYIEKSLDNTFYYGTYGDVPGEAVSSLDVTKFIFHYTIPENLFRGNYSVVATTLYGTSIIQYTAQFQITPTGEDITSTYQSGEKSLSTGFTPSFDTLDQFRTNSILLIGHADGLEINSLTRITSIQDAINLLNADFNSPLLRGVFDAYASGARDIYICPAAPMKEYIDDVNKRLEDLPLYAYEDATPVLMNFYERYYDRLEKTYSTIKDHDYIDIIVPLETSIINTGSTNFITQLAMYCQDFHDQSGSIQIGIIGSRNYGTSSSDIDIFEEDPIFQNKYTMYDPSGGIVGDMGRFIMAVYGEIVVNHDFLTISYTSSASAAVAGLVSQNPINQSLIRKKLPTAYGLSGVSLKQSEIDRLDNLGINTIVRSNRSRRGNAYEIYITNDYTMGSVDSSFYKIPQMRLISMVTKEIVSMGNNSISKFSLQTLVSDVKYMLEFLKNNSIIRDYKMEAYSDSKVKGKAYFDISLVSTLGLRKIAFSIASGQGA
jgi:hypothetical protein